MLTIAEVRALKDAELAERLDSAKQELMKLREKYATRQLEDTSQIRQAKRDVARLMTVRRQRALGAMAQENRS
ncbi:MAG: 50S ribosomal protein L29 [Chloroflexi bacterium]|nr:50S ribosomal protein L29 [Chloroflexota bacterium]MBI3732557.1 50S ribosomal protein L29 [Chloroflexota bacterium]